MDPDDRPVAGASVRIGPFPGDRPDEPGRRAISGPDGRFVLAGPADAKDRIGEATESSRRVVATAPGFGPGWADLEGPKELTIHLVADTPIEGRIVDAQGRPIAGVRARVHNIWASKDEDLASFIEDVKSHGRSPWQGPRALKLLTIDATATTDADGRFRLEGIGRERVAAIGLSGPTIVTEEVYAMTRTSPVVRPVGWEGLDPGARSYRGARFEHTAAACLPITGTVRDEETGRPIAGVKIRGGIPTAGEYASHLGVAATTDDQGRYVLTGLPTGNRYWLSASTPRGLPYVGTTVKLEAEASATGPPRRDIRLRKGVLIRGRVTDRATGRPVQSTVVYYPFLDQPPVGEDGSVQQGTTDDDGRFEIAAPPGRGILIAWTSDRRYLPVGDARNLKGRYRIPRLGRPTHPSFKYHAIVEIKTDPGDRLVTRDLQLITGGRLTGTVFDPDGKPVAETVAMGLDAILSRNDRVLLSADFTVEDIDPDWPRRLYFFQVERRLAGSVWIKGGEAGPISVRLQPWGVVTGRIVDDRGRPESVLLTSAPLQRSELDSGFLPRFAKAGEDGRFRIEGLVPGLRYSASVQDVARFGHRRAFRDLRVGPGETRDLGDIKLERYDPAKD